MTTQLNKGRRLGLPLLVLTASLALAVAIASAAAPKASIGNAQSIEHTTAKVFGSVDRGSKATTYRIQYSTQADFSGAVTAKEGTLETGTGSQPVEATLTGLDVHTVYHLRLVAENEDGSAEAIAAQTFETKSGIDYSFVSDVGAEAATLNAEVNPAGSPSTYRFEYVEKASYEADGWTSAISTNSAPIIGTPDPDYLASTRVEGLEPHTAYRFRVFVEDNQGGVYGTTSSLRTPAIPAAQAPDTCSNADLRAEQHATSLPDCRAYELVSPADKNGADVVVNPTRTRISPGESSSLPRAVMFHSLGGFADARGSGISFDYMAQRTGKPDTQGWSTHAVTPLQEPMTYRDILAGRDPLYLGEASSDLTRGIFRSNSSIGPSPNTGLLPNLYLRGDLRTAGTGSYQLVSDAFQPITTLSTPVPKQLPFLAGASDDLSHVYFESIHPLTPDAPTNIELAKAYVSVNGEVSFVGKVPLSGKRSCTGANCLIAKGPILAGRAASTSIGGSVHHLNGHPISADGTRTIFTAAVSTEGPSSWEGKLYQRDDQGTADTNDDTTTQINVTERTNPATTFPAMYLDAAVDGSRVAFITEERLTDNAPLSDKKLYLWDESPDAEEHHLTLLSLDQNPADSSSTGTIGVIGMSADGGTVYFVQRGQIVPGEPTLGLGFGIYVWRKGEGVDYVGQMKDEVADANWDTGNGPPQDQFGARVTPDGKRLLISLRYAPWPDGYDHGDCSHEEFSPTIIEGKAGCRQLYLYDGETGEHPLCVSCRPSGEAPSSSAVFHLRTGNGVAQTTTHLNSPMSEDGQRIFFSSPDPLLDTDTNGQYDAYMWEAVGKGSCEAEEINGGCLSLISSGTSADDSYFVEASPDGSDALFVTREKLSGWDFDGARDLYDARIDGGFPEPVPSPAPCVGEGCRVQTSGSPQAASTGSATLIGAGNAKETRKPGGRCGPKQRKVRKGGKTRCVKRQSKGRKDDKRTHRPHTNDDRRAGR